MKLMFICVCSCHMKIPRSRLTAFKYKECLGPSMPYMGEKCCSHLSQDSHTHLHTSPVHEGEVLFTPFPGLKTLTYTPLPYMGEKCCSHIFHDSRTHLHTFPGAPPLTFHIFPSTLALTCTSSLPRPDICYAHIGRPLSFGPKIIP